MVAMGTMSKPSDVAATYRREVIRRLREVELEARFARDLLESDPDLTSGDVYQHLMDACTGAVTLRDRWMMWTATEGLADA